MTRAIRTAADAMCWRGATLEQALWTLLRTRERLIWLGKWQPVYNVFKVKP